MEINLTAESAAMLTGFLKELRAPKTYPGPHFPFQSKQRNFSPLLHKYENDQTEMMATGAFSGKKVKLNGKLSICKTSEL